MDIEKARRFCLSLPFSTESIEWPDSIGFSVGGKPFAEVFLGPSANRRITFRCSREQHSRLLGKRYIVPGIEPDREHWITLLRFDALDEGELKKLIRESHQLVFSSLPASVQQKLRGSLSTE